jgi:hypothetical protein
MGCYSNRTYYLHKGGISRNVVASTSGESNHLHWSVIVKFKNSFVTKTK